MTALSRASKGRTSIWIAHRLSTVVKTDLIFVLQNGRIVEVGDHQSLISKPNSLYSSFWLKQIDAERHFKEENIS
jgi:hypothetical protein